MQLNSSGQNGPIAPYQKLSIDNRSKFRTSVENDFSDAIIQLFELNSPSESGQQTKLFNTIKTLIQFAELPKGEFNPDNYSNENDLILALGTKVNEKQTRGEQLANNWLDLIQNMYTVLKVFRKSDHNNNTNLYKTFSRPSRGEFNQDGVLESYSKQTGDKVYQNQTSWTSFFKDVIAYEQKKHNKEQSCFVRFENIDPSQAATVLRKIRDLIEREQPYSSNRHT